MVRPTGWVVDMRHYIDEDTGNPPEVIPERLAILFDAIVARVTDRLPDGDGHTNVLCRRSPGRRRCRGDIIARLDRSSGYIVWPCPLCGDHGMIHGWEDTLWSLYLRGLRRLVPVEGRHRADAVLFEVTSVLRWWLIGKILSMVLVGVLTTVGLWWLDVPLALTFGLPAAALTFIPNFGPVLSVVPPALLALADDPTRAAYVVVLYLAIQTVESYAVTPLIQRRTVSMPPALTIMSQLVLGVLVGGIGVAVATPLTAAAMTMIRMLYVEDLLEQDTPAEQATGTTDSRSQIRSPLE